MITIGDVAGRGVTRSRREIGQVRQWVRAHAFEGHPAPAALMDRLDLLRSGTRSLAVTTCLCGIFDPATGVLRFANAGHPPPLIRRADGSGGAGRRRAQPHPLGVSR